MILDRAAIDLALDVEDRIDALNCVDRADVAARHTSSDCAGILSATRLIR
jgi:hypothetical protein